MVEKRVEFEVEGQRLAGTVCGPEGKGPFPAVLVLHGRASNRQNKIRLIRELAIKGIIGLAFDFRGCGESEGQFQNATVENRLKDAFTAFDFLLSRKTDESKIGIFGSSLGAYLALLVSEKKNIKSLILRSPAGYDDFSISAIKKFKGSLLIIWGDQDEISPKEIQDTYFENAKDVKEKKFYIIKGANHVLSDPVWQKEFERLTCNWFKKTLK